MSYRHVCGYEDGAINSHISITTGTISISSSVARSGSRSLRANPTGTNVGYAEFGQYDENGFAANFLYGGGNEVAYLRIYFRFDLTLSSGTEEPCITWTQGDGSTVWAQLRLYNDGSKHVLRLYDATGLVATGTTALSTATQYGLQLSLVNNSAAGAYDLDIAGVDELSGTMDTSGGLLHHLMLGKFADVGGNSVDFYYDDLVVDIDGSMPSLSDGMVAIAPDASGTYSAWTDGTGSTFAEADDIPKDDGTTYLQSTATNDKHSLNFDSTASAGIGASDTIHFVALLPYVARVAATTQCEALLISGATEINASVSGFTVGTYQPRGGIIARSLDPDTGSAWTPTAVDAVEGGIEDIHATARARCTSIILYVDYTAAAAGGDLDVSRIGEPWVGRSTF